MNLTELTTAARLELSDAGTEWSASELSRTVDEVTADITRLMPLEKTAEFLFELDVDSESWVAVLGSWVALANKPIKWHSEAVTNAAGTTTYTRNTDYNMDYVNGKIKALAAGSIVNGSSCKISYDRDQLGIDISSLTDLLSVLHVESPLGNIPQSIDSFQVWMNILWITSQKGRSQTNIGDEQVVRVYYHATHTAPTANANGTFPRFLDEVMVKGMVAYALFIKHRALNLLSKTDEASARTAAASVDTELTAYNTAIANVDTELTAYNTAVAGMDTELAKVTTALAAIIAAGGPHAKIITALTAAAASAANATTALTKITTYLTGAASSAKWALDDIQTQNAVTLAKTALDLVASFIQKVHATGWASGDIVDAATESAAEVKHILTTGQVSAASNAQSNLDAGVSLINAVNLGAEAAALRRTYAETALAMAVRYAQRRADILIQAQRHLSQATGYVEEALGRLQQADRRINEAGAWTQIALGFANEAAQQVGIAQTYLGEADRWNAQGQLYIREADTWIAKANAWYNKAQGYLGKATAWNNKAQGYLGKATSWMQKASTYLATADRASQTADRFLADARERHTDYWNHLTSRVEQARRRSASSRWQYEAGQTTTDSLKGA